MFDVYYGICLVAKYQTHTQRNQPPISKGNKSKPPQNHSLVLFAFLFFMLPSKYSCKTNNLLKRVGVNKVGGSTKQLESAFHKHVSPANVG